MTDASAAQTGIHVNTGFHPLLFILSFFKPDVVIDGAQPYRVGWGDAFFPTPPGPHRVDVSFEYMIFGTVGKGSIGVEVPPGGVAAVTYRAPWLVFLPGKMAVTAGAPVALPGPAAPGVIGAPGMAAGVPQPQAQPLVQSQSQPAPAAPAAAEPQWDAQRNAYVQFDTTQQRWMQFDNALQQWVPII